MRMLDGAGIAYRAVEYAVDESDLSGVHAAAQLGEDPDQVFKTLVTAAPDGDHVVCWHPRRRGARPQGGRGVAPARRRSR